MGGLPGRPPGGLVWATGPVSGGPPIQCLKTVRLLPSWVLATLDTNTWSRSWSGGGRASQVRTDPANVSVGGGHLSLKLSKAGTGALVSSTPPVEFASPKV